MSKCKTCNKELGLLGKYHCNWCGYTYCSDCVETVDFLLGYHTELTLLELLGYDFPKGSFIKGYYLCKDCARKYELFAKKLDKAKDNTYKVELVSDNYHGYKRHYGEPHKLSTRYYKDKEDAKEELKILAGFYDDDIILNVSWSRQTEEEETEKGGIHRYSTWACRGVSYKKTKYKNDR